MKYGVQQGVRIIMNDVQGASWVENKTGDVCINVTLRLVSVTIVSVEKQ